MRGEKVERRGGEERDRDRVILKSENHIYFGINFEFLSYIYFGTGGSNLEVGGAKPREEKPPIHK